MTYHEMLAVVQIAQEAHARPEDEGGHNDPTLNLHCFLTALRDNTKLLGYPPGHLLHQFKLKFAIFVKKGWLKICDERCGGDHFALTEKGCTQLEEWNREGCAEHSKKARGRYQEWRGCAAPEVLKANAGRSPYGKSAA